LINTGSISTGLSAGLSTGLTTWLKEDRAAEDPAELHVLAPHGCNLGRLSSARRVHQETPRPLGIFIRSSVGRRRALAAQPVVFLTPATTSLPAADG